MLTEVILRQIAIMALLMARLLAMPGSRVLERVTLLPYHDLGKAKMRNIGGTPESFNPPSDDRVEEIRAWFRKAADMDVEILGKLD